VITVQKTGDRTARQPAQGTGGGAGVACAHGLQSPFFVTWGNPGRGRHGAALSTASQRTFRRTSVTMLELNGLPPAGTINPGLSGSLWVLDA
jgi:hypothetical protein